MDKEKIKEKDKREILKKIKSLRYLVKNAMSYKELLMYGRVVKSMERELWKKYPSRFGIERV